VAGAGPPGLPVFWSGFNPAVAWASVRVGAVVSDLYVETLSPRPPPRYHDGERWRPLAVRREEIAVRHAEPVELEVRETHHGPLVNPILGGDRPPMALRWTGALPGSALAFFDVARARGADELRRALVSHHEPVLAVVYCDRTGEAGMQVAGAIPDRRLPSSLLPVPGRDPSYDWHGRIAAERLPSRSLRGPGFVIAADGSFGEGGPLIEWLWHSGEREARLESLLREAGTGGSLDLRAMTELQRDVGLAGAREIVGRALELVRGVRLTPSEREVADLLRGWDGTSPAESRGAAAYHVFIDRLFRELFEPRVGRELLTRYLALGRVRPVDLVRVVLDQIERGEDASGWADPANAREAVRRSLSGTWLQLVAELGTIREKWSWGRLHPLRFRPLFEGAGPGLGPFAYPGDGSTVAVADYRPLDSFGVSTVASFRFAIDAAALDEALASLAPGQSELPGDPHRADALPRWLPGRSSLLATSRLVVEETAVSELRLEPPAPPARP
jgi:penicillin G amidase